MDKLLLPQVVGVPEFEETFYDPACPANKALVRPPGSAAITELSQPYATSSLAESLPASATLTASSAPLLS